MICFPNCKINLGLYITGKRDDGYHDLETVFYPVNTNAPPGPEMNMQLHDVLEAVPAAATTLHMSGLAVAGGDADNLVMKAYRLVKERYGERVPQLDIYLHKVIPMGAGLGGGSADGACMLRLLNDLCALKMEKKEMAELALQLGSDCPFFIYDTPQFATGRGEIMSPVDIDLSGYEIRVVCPGIHVSTAKAFGMITPRPAPYDLRQLTSLPVSEWRHHISNDFEEPVFAMHPELGDIKRQLYEQGAVFASMSGSGSAVYGIFRN